MRLKTRFARGIVAGVLTLALGASLAAAQETIDPTAQPTFGSADLSGGMQIDPFIQMIIGGGNIEASTVDPACTGYIASAPDYRIIWDTSAPTMRIYFASESDATLVVRDPVGALTCNDDAYLLDPLVEIPGAASGEYNIWVGTYSAEEFIPGYLMVSELPGTVDAPMQSDLLADVFSYSEADFEPTESGLDPNAAALFGSVTLQPGTLAQPHTVDVVSGGSNNVGMLGLGFGCIGYAATAPDFSFSLSGATPQIHVGFTAEDGGDTALIVRGPGGQFSCNDDTNGLDPQVTLVDTGAGEYDVWVASYQSDALVSGVLAISETGSAPVNNNVPPATTPEATGPIPVTGATSVPPAVQPTRAAGTSK